MPLLSEWRRYCVGATENAGLENAGPSKMQGWKMRDQMTGGKRGTGKRGTILQGVENARPTVMERRRYKKSKEDEAFIAQ